jgi:predicted 2-oxoglutarate/Fe(II)-dependent dioxygenase YbiX
MLDPAFFRLCGFLVDEAFLSEAECALVRSRIEGSELTRTRVVHGSDVVENEGRRRTLRAELPDEDPAAQLVEGRLAALKTRLEGHFGCPLAAWQRPDFLVYRTGDFFKAHADTQAYEGAPDFLVDRKITTVVFLGAQDGPEADEALVFHDLLPGLAGRGYPARLRPGTLVAFPSDVVHEVTPVQAASRYTLVTWFT